MAKLYTRKLDGTYVPYNPQSVTNVDVVQTTGNSVTAAMSQDAVTKKFATKQDTLTPGNGIGIEGNVIGVTAITESESQPDTSLWLNPSEDEETDVTYNRSQIDAMVGAKQDTLQLTVKDNGNIVLSNIQGQSKEFMPATPSGDPMHYAYIAAGAEYNDTGKDIVKTTPWADMVDDDADKTVIHKAGYWYLNGLGDLTTDEIRDIYTHRIPSSLTALGGYFNAKPYRTWMSSVGSTPYNYVSIIGIGYSSKCVVCNLMRRNVYPNIQSYSYAFYNCTNLKHLTLTSFVTSTTAKNAFINCSALISVKIKNLLIDINFPHSPLLSLKSILYMIQNEVATKAITITLHADAYARAMANADIVAALEAHPNVSLASA